ncbi:MAG: hypothetical protein LBH72_04665 [Proteiniphilum sp.]|jgi:hypothetical protein|nr:hypothetical protein [Proteiniphilum sp.]
MAKNRNNRKKKKSPAPASHVPALGQRHSKSYLDACHSSARRIIRAVGEDDALLDVFTKRQRQDIFRVMIKPPYVAAMSGHKVPKLFLRYMQETLTRHLKNDCFDEANHVTWMEMLTVGEAMMLTFMSEMYTVCLQPHQLKVCHRLLAALEATDLFSANQRKVVETLRVTLMSISQPNFRVYGLAPARTIPESGRPVIRRWMYVTTHKCRTLRFRYNDYERIAFRLFLGPIGDAPAFDATIAANRIFPGAAPDRKLNIYIQSHAIHRLKERIDTLHPSVRAETMYFSLMFVQRVVQGANGRMFIACIMPEGEDTRIVGYFAFTIEEDRLLILTFLPLLSLRVPEGGVMYERLHLSQEDVAYLGMDKLSFFYDVDIERIPALKRVLFDELHLEYVHRLYNSVRPPDETFNEKKTAFVKKFFREIEEVPFDSVGDPEVPPEPERIV